MADEHEIKATARAAKQARWRRIEDGAPKDGTPVDLWCVGEAADIDFYCPIHRRHANGTQREGRVTNIVWKDGAWRPKHGLRLMPLSVEPTHWMPMPPPPEENG